MVADKDDCFPTLTGDFSFLDFKIFLVLVKLLRSDMRESKLSVESKFFFLTK